VDFDLWLEVLSPQEDILSFRDDIQQWMSAYNQLFLGYAEQSCNQKGVYGPRNCKLPVPSWGLSCNQKG